MVPIERTRELGRFFSFGKDVKNKRKVGVPQRDKDREEGLKCTHPESPKIEYLVINTFLEDCLLQMQWSFNPNAVVL